MVLILIARPEKRCLYLSYHLQSAFLTRFSISVLTSVLKSFILLFRFRKHGIWQCNLVKLCNVTI